jgi:hypothetical protein
MECYYSRKPIRTVDSLPNYLLVQRLLNTSTINTTADTVSKAILISECCRLFAYLQAKNFN